MDTPKLDYVIPWLQEEVDVPDSRSALRIEGKKSGVNLLRDFSVKNGRAWRTLWDAFISHKEPRDKIYYFESEKSSWNQSAGRAGFAIVRDGKPVRTFTTRMN